MNVTVESHDVELNPSWKARLEDRLSELSDPRDPVISARSTISFREDHLPPAEVNLIVTLRRKNIVIHKRGDHVDGTLAQVLDTAKREIREFYDVRSAAARGRGARQVEEGAAPPPEPEQEFQFEE